MKNVLLPVLLVMTILLSLPSSTTSYSIQYSNNVSQDTDTIRTANVAEQVRSPSANHLSETAITSSTIWERSITSTHFTIYYNVTGPNGVSDEYAADINSSLEQSWTTEIGSYGFSSPPDSHITVYIMELSGRYGYTNGVYYLQLNEYHVENITIHRNMETNLMHYVCAHEFFHCIQLSYDNTASWFIQNTENWVIEGTAVWMGSMVYPEYAGDVSYVDYANQYMQNPDRTISELDYDAVLFWIFLYEHYGGFNTIKSVIQQSENLNAIQAVNATLNNLGTTFAEVFKEWTIANYLKDSYYSNGELFNSVNALQLPPYDGGKLPLSSDVADWGADYLEISSSVIYMPIQVEKYKFEGLISHNVTKILIEHGFPLVSDFLLNSSYIGFFPLMQANNLDKFVIIIRSLGNETSSNRVGYTLTFLASLYTLEGPYQLTPSTTTITTIETSGSHLSSTLTFTSIKTTSSQSSSSSTLAIVNGSSSQSSAETPLNVTSPEPEANLAVDNLVVVDQSCTVYADATYGNGTSYYVPVEVTVENVGIAASGSFNASLVVYWINGSLQEDLAEWRVPSLNAGENTTLPYSWRPAHTGYYNFTAVVDCDGEIAESDESDNTLVLQDFPVALMGDVNGDGLVDIMDAVVVCLAWGATPSDPQWNICADLNHDNQINIMDAVRICLHWGQTW